MWVFASAMGACLLVPSTVPAADEPVAATAILERSCLSCHDGARRKGRLSLATRSEALAGGESGPALVSGSPDKSLLLEYITGTEPAMPKSGPRLSQPEIQVLRGWIAAGAPWPKSSRMIDRSAPAKDWWSLQPLVRPAIPEIPGHSPQEPSWIVRNPVDAFIVARLRERGLSQSPEADRRTLLRRLYFDLVGLPPSPEETAAFLADPSPLAYEELVDRLLASPRYGETWARHWLDVAHFGETHGYDKDKPRPHAWPYRDYVIRSLNGDKPYGQFVEEQVAGDRLYPDSVDGLEALGFIAAGPWDFIGHAELPETKIDGQVARHLDRDDMVQNTIGTFCSLTVGCAQCHDHKFDPIPQREYYRLQAVFAAVDRTDKTYDRDPEVARRRREIGSQLAEHASEQQILEAELARRGGEEWRKLTAELEQLAKAQAAKPSPAYGYHSALADAANTVKWVQIDLGSPQPIGAIQFVGCYDDFNKIGAGFGFPRRFKIESADDAEFRDGVKVLADHTSADAPNPGVTVQSVAVQGCTARYVRFTATRLAPRLPTDFNFALAELSIYSPESKNISAGKVVSALDSIEAPPRWRRANLVDGSYYQPNQSVASQLTALSAARETLIHRLLDDSQRRRLTELASAIAECQRQLSALPQPHLAYVGAAFSSEGNFSGTGGKPRPIHVLARGDVRQPGESAGPGALSCVPGLASVFELPEGHDEGARRAALAKWLSSPRNPLTWRSLANRVWQYHVGRGIVDTPNDFGRMGTLPTHPELLDWLAVGLQGDGQSLKRLHRLIVTSHTYRQRSALDGSLVGSERDPAPVDADNRYCWRANRRRLSAEALRDAVLCIAGRLNLAQGGPSFQDFVIEQPAHSPHYEYGLHDPDDPRSHRRSIYRFIVRSQPQPFLTALDCADPSQRVDKRTESHSALQALALLNNGFMVVMSRHFAERLQQTAPNPEAQIELLFETALARRPTPDERHALGEFVKQYGPPNACRLMFNLNEFVFVD